MNVQKHSPLPWINVLIHPQSVLDGEQRDCFSLESDVCPGFSPRPTERDVANARLIVRAVNAHDELLAIVRELAENGISGYLENIEFRGDRVSDEGCELVDRARKALEKAGETA